MEGYVTAKEMAERWGISIRRVQILCIEGKIDGASRLGKVWAIPENAERPFDGRVTTGKYRDWRKTTIKSDGQ
ncbi:MAG: DNA-binding protein [Suipraeoptans sp.]